MLLTLRISPISVTLIPNSQRFLTTARILTRYTLPGTANRILSHSQSHHHIMSTLAAFVSQQKAQYLQAVRDGKGTEWTVAMGNEAGDLDSLASSIAFAWYRSAVESKPTVALVQTPRPDLHLRAENLHAMQLAGLDPSNPDILCIDDLPSTSPFPSTQFALVDHNRLLPQFQSDDAKVVAIIDHHEDEGFHKDTADPRIVAVPVGSAGSLVTNFLQSKCPDELPQELAILLLCGILIDTNGLQPGGKAEDVDRTAVAFLLPRSLRSSRSLTSSELHDVPELRELTAALSDKKGDVSHLNTRDLLRRDYKEYSLKPSSAPQAPILVGLATIPIGLKPWIEADDFWSSTIRYMDDRKLAILGILTSFRDHPTKKHERGKHRREQLFVVRDDVLEGLAEDLFKGLKHSETLDLKKRNLADDYETKKRHIPHGFHVKVWEQGNVHATRKVTAPLVKSIIEGKSDGQT